MRLQNERKKFWLHWGWSHDAHYFELERFEKVLSFEEEFLYKLRWQDEQGKALEATFEMIPSLEHAALGIHLICIIRTDSNESVEVEEWLFRSMLETAVHKIAEQDSFQQLRL